MTLSPLRRIDRLSINDAHKNPEFVDLGDWKFEWASVEMNDYFRKRGIISQRGIPQ